VTCAAREVDRTPSTACPIAPQFSSVPGFALSAGGGPVDRHERSVQLEHWPAGVGEVDLSLTVGDQHPMRAQKIGAQQHGITYPYPGLKEVAAVDAVACVLDHVGESHLGIPDRLVADRETPKWADPSIDGLLAHSTSPTSAVAQYASDTSSQSSGLNSRTVL